MRSAEHDRVWWSRVLLAVLSFGFAIAAGAGLLAAGMAIDPEDEVPRVWVIAPGVVALVGFIGAGAGAGAGAGVGGLAARIGSALLGLGTAAGGLWFLAETLSDGLPTTHAIIQFYLLLVVVVAVGLATAVVALVPRTSARPVETHLP